MAKVYRVSFEALNLKTLQEQVMTCHVQTDVPIAGTEPSAATVLDIVLDHFSSSGHNLSVIANAMYSSARLTRAVIREEVELGSGDIPTQASETLSIAGNNAESGDQTPDGLCPYIFFNTAAAIRSGRGGTHVPGPFNSNILDSNGRWDTTGGWWGSLSTLANAFADHMEDTFQTTGDVNFVVYSRTRRQRGQSPFVFQVEGAGARIQPRWLRRRMTRG